LNQVGSFTRASRHAVIHLTKISGKSEFGKRLFKRFEVLDESCQIYMSGFSSTIWNIFGFIEGIFIRF